MDKLFRRGEAHEAYEVNYTADLNEPEAAAAQQQQQQQQQLLLQQQQQQQHAAAKTAKALDALQWSAAAAAEK
ncbi:hypothetical protein, conserved [Eimeria necatrix]|uniref:Uncharacterized protein n=1 Tax=Eimeria necatrix TaxID=51315 RepID=U6MRG3_9EIME|nr:hypothetical protein, conserved [Eimeria necatrix]CDJ66812.1 hypothetical protein, conserved [Eimeria necatrix]